MPMDLEPNCLLTRYPLVFIASPKSLFSYFKFWRKLPKLFYEYGYETLVLTLPSKKNPEKRSQALHNELQKIEREYKRAHIMAERSAIEDLINLSNENLAVVVSLNLSSNENPHQLPLPILKINMNESSRMKSYLKHAIFLAENDLKCSH